jgi:hypothetical protein
LTNHAIEINSYHKGDSQDPWPLPHFEVEENWLGKATMITQYTIEVVRADQMTYPSAEIVIPEHLKTMTISRNNLCNCPKANLSDALEAKRRIKRSKWQYGRLFNGPQQ